MSQLQQGPASEPGSSTDEHKMQLSIEYIRELRILGVYPSTHRGYVMIRIKIPGGILRAEKARGLSLIADRFSTGELYITNRMSLQLHRVPQNDAMAVLEALEGLGMSTRGACGGAVRGISVNTPLAPEAPVLRRFALRLHGFFAGNPDFEGLPKKIKIGLDAEYDKSRHLAQDIGLVYAGQRTGKSLYDIWLGGGLGRKPHEAYLYAEKVPEDEVLYQAQAVVNVYKKRVRSRRRLKLLIEEEGPDALSYYVRKERAALPVADEKPRPEDDGPSEFEDYIRLYYFAGRLPADELRKLADLSELHCGGTIILIPDQGAALPLLKNEEKPRILHALSEAGLDTTGDNGRIMTRICPGSHECRVGLSPTREVAVAVLDTLGQQKEGFTLAVSGCRNSCTQPQLADLGIITLKPFRDQDGESIPRFTLLKRNGSSFGKAVVENVGLEELLETVKS
ncbi:MAG: hypothetical protein ACC669_06920, partial [bacterium]